MISDWLVRQPTKSIEDKEAIQAEIDKAVDDFLCGGGEIYACSKTETSLIEKRLSKTEYVMAKKRHRYNLNQARRK